MRQLDHAHFCPEQPLRGRPSGGGRRLLVSALWLSLLMGMSSPERPGGVKGAPLGAAKRTLDGEDRSEIIAEEESQRDGFRTILKRGASLAGTSLASETDAT